MVKNLLPTRQAAVAALLLLSVASYLGVGWAAPAAPGRQSLTGPVVTDWRTGVALYGVDPVGYFIRGQVTEGAWDFEFKLGQASWLFRNSGNRAAFAADPAAYAPAFGGYDPAAIARGVAAPGNPRLWAILDGRLYLFNTPQSREAFRAAPAPMLAAAAGKWPALAQTSALGALAPEVKLQSSDGTLRERLPEP
jgi:hypothetical protein